MYRHWVSELREKLLQQFKDQEEEFSTEARQYEEVQQTIDLEIMRNSLVVGMTTTGAARLQSLLKALKPKIGKLTIFWVQIMSKQWVQFSCMYIIYSETCLNRSSVVISKNVH